MSDDIQQSNSKLVRQLLFVVVAMFGFGYALVPIYDVFCEITGLNGKTSDSAVQEAQAYDVNLSRNVTLELITSINESAPIAFKSEVNKLKVHPGKYYTVNFIAENKTDEPMIARAIPSVTPGLTAEFLQKTECFCFQEQKFEAHERKVMPVRFVIDPELPEKYKTMTLAYTFFDNTDRTLEKQK